MVRTLGWLSAAALALGLVMAFGVAPREVSQGNVQRIMYVHPPLAWVAYLAFGVVAAASIAYLVRRAPGADRLAHASAEVGVLFTGLAIATGSIWGKPTWGVWWTWDARLTLTAILLLIFAGYLMLRRLTEDENRAASSAAVLGIIGFLDIPLIHMSVYWWRTLHQPPSILRPDKAPWENIAWPLLIPLLLNLAAFLFLYFYLLSLRFRLGEITAEIKALKLSRDF